MDKAGQAKVLEDAGGIGVVETLEAFSNSTSRRRSQFQPRG